MKEWFLKLVSLKYIKERKPAELVDYAVANNIDHDPEFAWWVTFALHKRSRMVSKLHHKYWSKTHKLGIEVLASTKKKYWRKMLTNKPFIIPWD